MEVTLKTVQAIIKGSDNIDRMRSEINRIVSMVSGLLPSVTSGGSSGRFSLSFGSSAAASCEWIVWGELYPLAPKNNHITVECWVSDCPGSSLGFSTGCPGLNNMRNIQNVYLGLPVLVGGIFSKYPELEEKIKPLIWASEMKF